MARGVFWLRHGVKGTGGRPKDAACDVGSAAEATPADLRVMERALALAREAAAAGEVPVGAVVYHTASGRVLGEGANTREGGKDPAGHAEFTAMLAAARAVRSWRLDDCTLVVTLEPCAMCAGLIVNARVGRVVYGAKDSKAGFVGSLGNLLADERLNHRVRAIAGVQEAECSRLLSGFFDRLRAERKKQKKSNA